MISGFQRLRYLEGLQITEHPRLLAVDGLSEVAEVSLRVDIVNNPLLCFALDSLSDKVFWQVCFRVQSCVSSLGMCSHIMCVACGENCVEL